MTSESAPAGCTAVKKILITDDSRVCTVLYSHHLKRAGFTVAVAHDGYECLRMLQDATKPDLLLLDMEMPGIGGSELIVILAQDPALNNIPVIILSGLVDEAHAGMKMFGVTCLSKHMPIDAMISFIKANLAKTTGPVTLPDDWGSPGWVGRILNQH